MFTCKVNKVTPHVGVWIETSQGFEKFEARDVTPHVGVWIETPKFTYNFFKVKSHLM